MKKSFQLPLGGIPLAEYYNELNLIFKELDYQRLNDMTCVANMNKGSVLLRIKFIYFKS